jgi:hypothetical protein
MDHPGRLRKVRQSIELAIEELATEPLQSGTICAILPIKE